jgi:hypothetical protein
MEEKIKMINKNANVILYGAGGYAMKALDKIRKHGMTPVCFCDSDVSKHGTTISDLPVMSFDEARSKYDDFSVYVAVVYQEPRNAIMSFLSKSGVNEVIIDVNSELITIEIISTAPQSSERLSNYKLYVENESEHIKIHSKDYSSNEKLTVRTVENGIILPTKNLPENNNFWMKSGGVVDSNGNFVAGHTVNKTDATSRTYFNDSRFGAVSQGYSIPEVISHIDETVMYGGVIFNLFGHMIIESLSRMWWYLENCSECSKIVFVSFSGENRIDFKDFFDMLGICQTDIYLIDTPICFSKVIVPEQSHYLLGPYNQDYTLRVYDAIRGSVKPAEYKKIYLTKSQIKKRGTMNEEYFESYFRSKGHEIIVPEKLSLKELVAVMSGAQEVVCTSGTLQHFVLFCRNKIKLTVLNTTIEGHQEELWINQAKEAQCTYIDVCLGVYINVLPHISKLLLPTSYWKKYLCDNGDNQYPCDFEATVKEFALSYITQIVKILAERPDEFTMFNHFSHRYLMADFVVEFHRYILNEKLSEETKKVLYENLKI